MIRKALFFIVCCMILSCTSSNSQETVKEGEVNTQKTDNEAPETGGNSEIKQTIDTDIPEGAAILIKCYPNFIKEYKDGKLIFTDGTSMVYDDKREKSFEEKLDDADPEDMFAFVYNRKSSTPDYLQDAGRSR